jgi:hypothetical protein
VTVDSNASDPYAFLGIPDPDPLVTSTDPAPDPDPSLFLSGLK